MLRKQFTEFSTGCWRDLWRRRAAAMALVSLVLTSAGGVAANDSPGAASRDFVGSAEELRTRAEAGDPWAQLNLGAAFDRGMAGLPLDPVRAVAWYRRAAEAGLAEAQFNLAHSLVTGSGTRRDTAAGLRWMLRAAAQNLPSAQYLAGVMHAEGLGTAPDVAQAIIWLERASGNGNQDAARLLTRLRAAD